MTEITYWTAPPPPPEIEAIIRPNFDVVQAPIRLTSDVGSFWYDGTDDARWIANANTPTIDRSPGGYNCLIRMSDDTWYRAVYQQVLRYLSDNGYTERKAT